MVETPNSGLERLGGARVFHEREFFWSPFSLSKTPPSPKIPNKTADA